MDTLISKVEALLLGTKNCLVEFCQVLDVNRLLAAFVSVEAELVDEFPDTLGLLARFNVSEKVAHGIDFFAIFGAYFGSSHFSIVAPEYFLVGS